MSSSATVLPNIGSKFVAIDDHIFLGTMKMLSNPSLIKEFRIRRILTLTAHRPDRLSDKVSGVYYKHKSFDEYLTHNLIIFFDECNQYISEGLKYDENVVIVSKESESMSVSIVIAFLMTKYRLSADDGLYKVFPEKWNIPPIEKFYQQLYLWQLMKFTLNPKEPLLRQLIMNWFRFELQSIINRQNSDFDSMRKSYLSLGLNFMSTIDYIEAKEANLKRGLPYYCLKCDKRMFWEINTIQNKSYSVCKYIYTEPIYWVIGITYQKANSGQDLIKGPINCLKCEQHVGDYDWRIENMCNCPLHRGLRRYLSFKFFSDYVRLKLKK